MAFISATLLEIDDEQTHTNANPLMVDVDYSILTREKSKAKPIFHDWRK